MDSADGEAFATVVGPNKELLLLDQSTSLLYQDEETFFGYYNENGQCVQLNEGMDELIGARLPQRINTMPGFEGKLLNEHNLLTFTRTGMVVLDGVCPAELVTAVREELAEAAEAGDLELEAPANNQAIRQDKVLYLPFFEQQTVDSEAEEGGAQQPTAVDTAAALLESIGAELNEAFARDHGASAAAAQGTRLPVFLRPEMFMLAGTQPPPPNGSVAHQAPFSRYATLLSLC